MSIYSEKSISELDPLIYRNAKSKHQVIVQIMSDSRLHSRCFQYLLVTGTFFFRASVMRFAGRHSKEAVWFLRRNEHLKPRLSHLLNNIQKTRQLTRIDSDAKIASRQTAVKQGWAELERCFMLVLFLLVWPDK